MEAIEHITDDGEGSNIVHVNSTDGGLSHFASFASLYL